MSSQNSYNYAEPDIREFQSPKEEEDEYSSIIVHYNNDKVKNIKNE
jgi:hypothetical protein